VQPFHAATVFGGSPLRHTVKLIYREGTQFLYAHHAAPFEHMGREEAKRFISTMFGAKRVETTS